MEIINNDDEIIVFPTLEYQSGKIKMDKQTTLSKKKILNINFITLNWVHFHSTHLFTISLYFFNLLFKRNEWNDVLINADFLFFVVGMKV